jgi:hypothetical protein
MDMRLFLLVTVAGIAMAWPGPAPAQPCTADSQCSRGYGPQATCIGDTLVVKRSICLGGQCREQEERRETCRSGERSSCNTGVFQRTIARCDALLGRCVERTERDVCEPSCACRGSTMRISTGQCAPSLGCNRVVLKCDGGCTCAPEPKCLDAPATKTK